MLKVAIFALALSIGALFCVPVQAQNAGGTLLASAARTASVNSADQVNLSGDSVHVIVDVTAYTSGTLTVSVQGKDPASGKYYTLLSSAALAATGTTVLKVGKGLPATANVSANDLLPLVWRVSVVGASTPIATFSVGFMAVQ